MNKNINKILEISKKYKLTHIGSCISVLPILEEIYKRDHDIVIMDNAHAHLSHLIVSGRDPNLISKDIHCNREVGCDALGGSLGHGLGISIGYALAGRKVDCVTSDGAMMEGSNWEALRIADKLNLNLTIYCNFNGYTAVSNSNPQDIARNMQEMAQNIPIYIHYTDNGEGFDGVQGHYKQL